MGKRGPKREPTLLTITAATASDPAAPPVEVTTDKDALVIWHRVVNDLRQLGTWHAVDQGVVARYAITIALWRAALANVRKNGPSMQTKTGYQAPTPAATLMLKLSAQALAMETTLGMTPRSRSRMKVDTPHAPDPLDEFLTLR
jgi:P27 family predicted phage terminase small subunit